MLEQGRPLIPGHSIRAMGDVIACHGRERDRAHLHIANQLGGEIRKIGGDLGKAALVKADEVHFVYRQHHMPNAEQRANKGVPPGLG